MLAAGHPPKFAGETRAKAAGCQPKPAKETRSVASDRQPKSTDRTRAKSAGGRPRLADPDRRSSAASSSSRSIVLPGASTPPQGMLNIADKWSVDIGPGGGVKL